MTIKDCYIKLLSSLNKDTWRYTKLFTDSLPNWNEQWACIPEIDSLHLPIPTKNYLAFFNKKFYKNQIINVKADSINNSNLTMLNSIFNKPGDEKIGFPEINWKYSDTGIYLIIPDNTVIAEPIHIHYQLSSETSKVYHPRTLINVGKNSKIILIESYNSAGDNAHWQNAYTQVQLQEQAAVEHIVYQESSQPGYCFLQQHVTQQTKSSYQQHYFSFGKGTHHHKAHIKLLAANAKVKWFGLHGGKAKENRDSNIILEHIAPQCDSFTLLRGVFNDSSKGAFTGKIHVHPFAKQSNAQLENKNLLLTKSASANSRPQLEIYNDDVRCTHGATVGHLDDKALFYLCSRGISPKNAQRMLLKAFFTPILQDIPVMEFKKIIENNIDKLLDNE